MAEDSRIPQHYSPDEISEFARRVRFFYSEVLGEIVVKHSEERGFEGDLETHPGTITGCYSSDEEVERLRSYIKHFDGYCRKEGYGDISIRGDPEDKGKLVLEINEEGIRVEELIEILEKANLASFS
jgi:hypothetical protein